MSGRYYPIGRLNPLQGCCDDFWLEVKKLQRPYIPITPASYQTLLEGGADYYRMPGKQGKVVTFGNADGGYCLMPLKKDEASLLLESQPRQ